MYKRTTTLLSKILTAAMVAAIAGLVGCSAPQPKGDEAYKQSPNFPDIHERITGELPPKSEMITDTENTVPSEVTKPEIQRGSGVFINEQAARRSTGSGISEQGEVHFNFEAMPIQDAVKAVLGDMLGVNYVISPGVSGEVTFSTSPEKPLNREQVIPILEMLLRWNNAAMIVRDGQYTILPVNNAIPGNLTPRIARPDAIKGYNVLAVPLEYVSATQMQTLLQPYVREGAIVSADPARSMLVLAGTPTELQNYLQTIEVFDVDWLEGMSVGIFPLERVEVGEVVPELQAVFGEEANSPLSGMFRFMEIQRLNSVLVITPQAEYLDKAEEWILRLDRGEGAGTANRLYVYRVENLEAAVLADYLVDIFGGSRGGSQRRENDRGRVTAGSLGTGLEPVTTSTINREAENPLGLRQNQDRSDSGMSISDNNDNIAITAAEETNSLLIQATPSQYNNILSAIKRLDTEPLQVLIEAHVLQVALNENLQYGVNYFLQNFDPNIGEGADAGAIIESNGSTFKDTPNFNSFVGQGGGTGLLLSYVVNPMSAFGDFFQSVVTALEEVSETRTVSSPSLLVRNNTEATINVGTQLAIANTTFNGVVTGNNNTASTTQYVSTGTILSVTPRVNPGGLVYLQLNQEVSARAPGEVGPNGNPNINTSNISTDVAVQSGQSIILGGLIRDDYSESESGIPFLRRIPWLGRLFGTTSYESARSELIVILKPTVIESIDSLQSVSDDLRNTFQGLKPFQRPSVLPNEEIPRHQTNEEL